MKLWILTSSHSQCPLTPMVLYFSKKITIFATGTHGETLRANITTITWGVFVCVCTILQINHDGFILY